MMRSAPHRNVPTRRAVLGALAAAPVALAHARAALAEAPVRHTLKHGPFEVTVITDGHLVLPARALAGNTAPAELEALLASGGQKGEFVEPPASVTLIRTPTELICVDAGAGPNFMPTLGKLPERLEAAGIDRATVTKVVYTHCHPDHLWGTIDEFDDTPLFPKATYVLSEGEWNFWMADDVLSRLPESRQNFAPGAQRNLTRIKERLATIKPGAEVAPGITVLGTPGHSAGHISLELAAGNEALIVLGDALTHPLISFGHPDWKPESDHFDADLAVATRRKLLSRLAADRAGIIGYHLPFPGLGRAEAAGQAYRFVADA